LWTSLFISITGNLASLDSSSHNGNQPKDIVVEMMTKCNIVRLFSTYIARIFPCWTETSSSYTLSSHL